jgi:hypothetical protein
MKTIAVAVSLMLSALALSSSASAWEKECLGCKKPRPHYDSEEVLKTQQDIDRSRVINTRTVVRRVRVVEPPVLVRVPAVKVIEVVVQSYRMVEVGEFAYRPSYRHRPMYRRVLRVRG